MLSAILLVAAALRMWRLDQNGFGTEYYSAAVFSMSTSWHNFLFNAFDPGGFVSIDKPPLAFWIQVASVKLFGFQPYAILLPQVVEGLLSIVVLYRLVSRRFGPAAGLLAASFLALTPISVAVDRSSNTESCLVLFLLLAGWAGVLASERASLVWLAVCLALVGLAFNVKMLIALGIVPVLVSMYLFFAPLAWRWRLMHLSMAGTVLVVVSLSWSVFFDLTPASERPYAGSSSKNSMLELAVAHNALERFVRPAARVGTGAPANTAATTRSPYYDDVPTGLLRLADLHLARQIGWWLPLAAFGLAALLWRQRARPRPDWQLCDLVLWGGWMLVYGLAFSFAGGIFHAYYLAVLAPPLAALSGAGLVALWRMETAGSWPARSLSAALLACVAWQVYYSGAPLGFPADLLAEPREFLDRLGSTAVQWRTWLFGALLFGGIAAVVGAAFGAGPNPHRRSVHTANAVAILALFAMPVAWALGCTLIPGNLTLPAARFASLGQGRLEANPALPLGSGRIPFDPKLFDFLARNRGTTEFLLAAPNARLAAPIIIRTGQPVMAIGGFMGSDPIIDPDGLGRRVAAGEVRYLLLAGPGSFGLGRQYEARRYEFVRWAMRNGVLVDTAQWRSGTVPWLRRAWLYDLAPGNAGPALAQ